MNLFLFGAFNLTGGELFEAGYGIWTVVAGSFCGALSGFLQLKFCCLHRYEEIPGAGEEPTINENDTKQSDCCGLTDLR